ncbi:MAG: DciA family protein [Pseudomonadales bacterium]
MSRKVSDLLSEHHQRFTPLQKLLRRAANQESWTAQLQALLPDRLGRDCRVVDVRGSIVFVVCRHAATATRLRFMAPDLLGKLTQLGDFRAATKINIRVSAE